MSTFGKKSISSEGKLSVWKILHIKYFFPWMLSVVIIPKYAYVIFVTLMVLFHERIIFTWNDNLASKERFRNPSEQWEKRKWKFRSTNF